MQRHGKQLEKDEKEYKRKLDEKMSQIVWIQQLQLRAVVLIETALQLLLVGVANFMSRLMYEDMYAVDSSDGTLGAP